jgi:hypothetical protein
MSLKATQLMLKKLYQKTRQIVVEWHNHTMVVQEVVCVDHHQERVVVVVEVAAADGAQWVVDRVLVVVVEVVVDTDLVVVAAVAMEPAEIMVIGLDPMVAAMVVIWVAVV